MSKKTDLNEGIMKNGRLPRLKYFPVENIPYKEFRPTAGERWFVLADAPDYIFSDSGRFGRYRSTQGGRVQVLKPERKPRGGPYFRVRTAGRYRKVSHGALQKAVDVITNGDLPRKPLLSQTKEKWIFEQSREWKGDLLGFFEACKERFDMPVTWGELWAVLCNWGEPGRLLLVCPPLDRDGQLM